jgi:hypothetical protein
MLCPHAYGTDASRPTCRSGARRPDRMEVGRRERHHPLQRPTHSGGATSRDLNWIESGQRQRVTPVDTYDEPACVSASSQQLPKLRNPKTRQRGHHPEFGRGRGRETALRTVIAARTLCSSLLRWPSRSGLLPHCAGIHIAGSCARRTYTHRSDSRPERAALSGIGASSLHRSSGIFRAAARWPRASSSPAGKAQGSAGWQQTAQDAAQLLRIERCASQGRSAHEQTRSAVAPASGFHDRVSHRCRAIRGWRIAAPARRAIE